MKFFINSAVCVIISSAALASETSANLEEAFKYYKDHVVAINNENVMLDGLTGDDDQSVGTGFVIDPKRGLVCTNYHVFSHTMVGEPHIVMTDGHVYEPEDVKLVYSNPTGYQHDFSILKINKFKHQLEELFFEPNPLKIDSQTKVGIMGCNDGIPQSLLTGYLADKYSVTSGEFGLPYGTYPTYTLSVSIEGGSSGSPVFDSNKKILGINAAGTKAHAFIVPIYYIIDVIKGLGENKIKPSYTLGLDFSTKQIYDLKAYRDFQDGKFEKKISETPDYRKRALEISKINPFIAKPTLLQKGDVLKAVNGQIMGPDYYQVHKAVNEAGEKGKTVELTVERFGKELKLVASPFKINFQRPEMVEISDSKIFSATETFAYHYGIKPGTPLISFPGSEEDDTDLVKITQINNEKVETFRDFITQFNNLLNKKKYRFTLFLEGVGDSSYDHILDMNLMMEKNKKYFITQFKEKENSWDNISFKKYLSQKKNK